MPSLDRTSALLAILTSDHPGLSQQAILDEIRRAILTGDVPPGSPIPVDDTADLFGVSRIPIRETLKTLIGEGLVDHQPRAGYTVASLTVEEFREIYVVRGVLEMAALKAAVDNAGAQDDQRPGRRWRPWTGRWPSRTTGPTNGKAGASISRWSARRRMPRLLHMIELVWNLTEPIQPMTHINDAHRSELHGQHSNMLRAFTDRDSDALLEPPPAGIWTTWRPSLRSCPPRPGCLPNADPERSLPGNGYRPTKFLIRPPMASTVVWTADRGVNASAASGQRLDLIGGQVEICRLHIEFQLFNAGGARNDDDPRLCQQPGQRDLRGFRVVRVRDLPQQVEQWRDPVQVLGAEQRVHRPNAARTVVRAVLSAEQTLRQRAVGDHDPVLVGGERHHVPQRGAVGQRELHLIAEDRPSQCGIRCPPTLQ